MKLGTFFEKFDLFADAPDAVAKMRSLVLDLAVRGKLVDQEPQDGDAAQLLTAISRERDTWAANLRSPKEPASANGDAQPFQIPSTWVWTQLGNIALQIQYGYTASADASATEIRMLRITDIQNNRVDWPSVPGCQIDPGEAEKYLLGPNDILIARTGGTIGKSFIVPDAPVKSVFASYLIRVTPPRSMAARYLKIFLESPLYWAQLREMSAGTGQPNVNGQALGRLEIPLPPLAEQKRIVAKVDELMALCDRLEAQQQERETRQAALARSSLTRFSEAPKPANLDFLFHRSYDISPADLRKSILTLAVRGKLVPQDPNDEPASDFIARIASQPENPAARDQDTFQMPFDVPSTWYWVKLGVLVESMANGIYKPSKFYSESGTACVRMFNIQDGRLDLTKLKRLDLMPNEIEQYHLEKGDLLVNRVNSRELVGKCAVVTTIDEPLVFEAMNIRIRLVERRDLPSYVNLVLRTDRVREFFQGTAKQAIGQASINQPQVAGLAIPLPPVAEQRRIVAKVDALMTFVDSMEMQISAARTAATPLLEALVAELGSQE